MAFPTVIVGIVVLVIGLVAVYKSIRIVEEGDTEALFVFGEMKAVLHPGFNFVPPFVSKTYPIDPRAMTMDRDGEQVTVPAEFETAVRDVADPAGTDPARKSTRRTWSDSDPAITSSTRQRAATVFGRTLFVLGAFGLAVPMFMLGHVLEYERWAVSWLFPEATPTQVVLTTVLSLSVMVLGEKFGRRYGTWGEES